MEFPAKQRLTLQEQCLVLCDVTHLCAVYSGSRDVGLYLLYCCVCVCRVVLCPFSANSSSCVIYTPGDVRLKHNGPFS